jgi:hypothetical protein
LGHQIHNSSWLLSFQKDYLTGFENTFKDTLKTLLIKKLLLLETIVAKNK